MVTGVEPKESKRQAWIVGALIVFFLFCAAAFNAQMTIPLALASPEGTPTVWIRIHRMQAIDAIEGFLEDGADWSYTITMWDGEKWVDVAHDAEGNHDDITVDKTHSFKVEVVTTTFYIILLERDSGAWEVADISSHSGSVKGDQRVPPPRGAMYEGIYNLKDNSLKGDKTYIEEGYYKTSGDYDGSTGIDENDANLWFAVWDNYESPEARARALNPKVYTYDKVNFDGSASKASAGSTIVKYEWDFDEDGIIDAEGEKTSYTYTKKGRYTVTLMVTDSLGETHTGTCVVEVRNRPPTASFTFSPSKPTTQDTVSFIDRSEDLDGTVISWLWEFGDGATSTEQNPAHKYADDGTYIVKLTVTDNDGAINTKSEDITILNTPPTSDFTYTPTKPKEGQDVQFTDKSIDLDGKIVAWHWDFGDGYTSSKRNPTHKYEKIGEYAVKLTVKDDDGATDTTPPTIITVKENMPPLANFAFSPTEPAIDQDVRFTDESEDPDGVITLWHWDFGDGTTSTEQNPIHRYEEAGTYTVKLTVTDDGGKTSSEATVIEIIRVYDLTIEVRDLLGFAASGAEVKLHTNEEEPVSGVTDAQGKVTLSEVPEGEYLASVTYMGQTIRDTLSLFETKTQRISVAISPYTLGVSGVVIVAICGAVTIIRKRRKALPSPAPVTAMVEEKPSPPEEIKFRPPVRVKLELEKERITEMLKAFKEKYEGGEISEEAYKKLKSKYEEKLKEIERQL